MVSIRLASINDFEFFYMLKSEEHNIFWSGGKGIPNKENLKLFFNNIINNANKYNCRKILIIENENKEKVGHLYINPNEDEFELACAIIYKFCGKGYAKEAIKKGLDIGRIMGYKKMVTYIREDNIASQKAYLFNGVKLTGDYIYRYIPKLSKEIKMNKVEYYY